MNTLERLFKRIEAMSQEEFDALVKRSKLDELHHGPVLASNSESFPQVREAVEGLRDLAHRLECISPALWDDSDDLWLIDQHLGHIKKLVDEKARLHEANERASIDKQE